MSTRLLINSAAIVAVLMAGCSDDGTPGVNNNNTSNTTVPSDWFVLMKGTYTLPGADQLTIATPAFNKCVDSTMTVEPAVSQTVQYTIANDVLKLPPTLTPLTTSFTRIPGLDPAFITMLAQVASNPMAAAFIKIEFTRDGANSTIEDRWLFDRINVDMVRAVFGDSVTAPVDTINESFEGNIALEFDADTVRAWLKKAWYAATVTDNLCDTALYDVSVVTVNDTTLRLNGNADRMDDEITLTYNTQGDVLYRHSDGRTHTYYMDPATCPNLVAPEWFVLFLLANQR